MEAAYYEVCHKEGETNSGKIGKELLEDTDG
jgi:hypothetical protein